MTRQEMNNSLVSYTVALVDEELCVSTRKKYLHNILIFLDFCPDGFVDKRTVLAFKRQLFEKFSPLTVNSYIISINRFFTWLKLPDLQVKTIKIQKRQHLDYILNIEEYERLLTASRNAENPRNYLLLRTLAGTGIRISELNCITYEAVLVGMAQVHGKGKYRCVFISEEMAMRLLSYCQANNITSGIIFKGNISGWALHPSGVWRILKRIAVEAGVAPEKVYPHSLRHLFAKTYMSKVGNLCELADILGHSNIETTRIYAMTSIQEKLQSISTLNL